MMRIGDGCRGDGGARVQEFYAEVCVAVYGLSVEGLCDVSV